MPLGQSLPRRSRTSSASVSPHTASPPTCNRWGYASGNTCCQASKRSNTTVQAQGSLMNMRTAFPSRGSARVSPYVSTFTTGCQHTRTQIHTHTRARSNHRGGRTRQGELMEPRPFGGGGHDPVLHAPADPELVLLQKRLGQIKPSHTPVHLAIIG